MLRMEVEGRRRSLTSSLTRVKPQAIRRVASGVSPLTRTLKTPKDAIVSDGMLRG